MKPNLSLIVCLFLCLHAYATPKKSITQFQIASNSVDLDYVNGVNTYTGNVKAWDKTTTITADKLVVYSNKNKHLKYMVATGKLASYHTRPSLHDDPVDGEAEQIIYDGKAHSIFLVGHARAKQAANTFQGPELKYDIRNKTLRSVGHKKDEISISIAH